MTKGDKMIIEMLHSHAHPHGQDFSNTRNLYYDSLTHIQAHIASNIANNTSQGMEKLKIQVEDLKMKNREIADVLEDVEKTTRYDV